MALPTINIDKSPVSGTLYAIHVDSPPLASKLQVPKDESSASGD